MYALKIVDDALIAIAWRKDAVYEIRSWQVKHLFGDGLGGVLEQVIGFVAEGGYDGVDHCFFR
jgi:hypothetical protein